AALPTEAVVASAPVTPPPPQLAVPRRPASSSTGNPRIAPSVAPVDREVADADTGAPCVRQEDEVARVRLPVQRDPAALVPVKQGVREARGDRAVRDAQSQRSRVGATRQHWQGL